MALIGTISGSVGSGGILTSNNAITGTLVVANVSTNFPALPSDTVFFVSGSTSGATTQAVFGGGLVVSGTSKFISGLSGSLTQLNDGTSYLIAGSNVTITSASNGPVTISSVGFSSGYTNAIFGDGSDGDVTISASTTMTREQHYNNLTIGTTGILKPRGFRIFVKGTLTIESGGSINDDGNNATGGTPGTGLGATGFLDGQSSAGGNSRGSLGAGNAGVALGSTVSLNSNGVLPVGGAGGASGTGQAGGAGGTCTQITPSQRWSSTAVQYAGRAAGSAQWKGGSGGGGGGADPTGGTCVSGAGGGGGGLVYIAANTITNNGTISANGGNGGNASFTGTANAGGGGGGGAGHVCVVTKTNTSLGTITANGGTGGAGAGASGLPGGVGTSGTVVTMVVT